MARREDDDAALCDENNHLKGTEYAVVLAARDALEKAGGAA